MMRRRLLLGFILFALVGCARPEPARDESHGGLVARLSCRLLAPLGLGCVPQESPARTITILVDPDAANAFHQRLRIFAKTRGFIFASDSTPGEQGHVMSQMVRRDMNVIAYNAFDRREYTASFYKNRGHSAASSEEIAEVSEALAASIASLRGVRISPSLDRRKDSPSISAWLQDPTRHLFIYRSDAGWSFQVTGVISREPIVNVREARLSDIPRHVRGYTRERLDWRDYDTGKSVDLDHFVLHAKRGP